MVMALVNLALAVLAVLVTASVMVVVPNLDRIRSARIRAARPRRAQAPRSTFLAGDVTAL